MKILVVGDLHGQNIWKQILLQHPDCDKVIFVGDYFDSKKYHIDSNQQLVNFDEILRLKRLNTEKVTLLIGNHEYHYFDFANETYGGFQSRHQDSIRVKLHRALDRGYLQMAYTFGNQLFTHAGVTKKWCEKHFIDLENIEASINQLFISKPEVFANARFIPNSPIWIRPEELLADAIDDYVQIVGHTQQQNIKIEHQVVFVDALNTVNEYLIIDKGSFEVGFAYLIDAKLRSQPDHGTFLGFEGFYM